MSASATSAASKAWTTPLVRHCWSRDHTFAWRSIPVGKWSITMVTVISLLSSVVPLPNGLNGKNEWWDDPLSGCLEGVPGVFGGTLEVCDMCYWCFITWSKNWKGWGCVLRIFQLYQNTKRDTRKSHDSSFRWWPSMVGPKFSGIFMDPQ